MFKRDVLSELEKWSEKINRKPLVLRGARQVGKTTVVHQFAAGHYKKPFCCRCFIQP